MKKYIIPRARVRATYILSTFFIYIIMVVSLPLFDGILTKTDKFNYYQGYLNGKLIGCSKNKTDIVEAMQDARAMFNSQSEEPAFVAMDLKIKGSNKVTGKYKSKSEISNAIYNVFMESKENSKDRAYIVDIDGVTVTLKSIEQVEDFLNTVKNKYDTTREYKASLETSSFGGFGTITCSLDKASLSSGTKSAPSNNANLKSQDMSFQQDIEIIDSFVSDNEIEQVDNAVSKVTNNETKEEGLSVIVDQKEKYTEQYSLDTQYIFNENMYNNKQNVLAEAQTGTKEYEALVCYKDGKEVSRKILSEKIVKEAVAQVIEVGTVPPPEYIKPIDGGSISSYFEERWGTFHKGIDWACNIGTNVYAAAAGEIVNAGWVNGYGYCIEVAHSNGSHTRYGHLSQINVSYGQTVNQGDVIGLSGNTGNSTGPHLHFEVIINGGQVNPLDYLN